MLLLQRGCTAGSKGRLPVRTAARTAAPCCALPRQRQWQGALASAAGSGAQRARLRRTPACLLRKVEPRSQARPPPRLATRLPGTPAQQLDPEGRRLIAAACSSGGCTAWSQLHGTLLARGVVGEGHLAWALHPRAMLPLPQSAAALTCTSPTSSTALSGSDEHTSRRHSARATRRASPGG